MQRLILFLFVIAILFGSPYAATILYRAMGPWDTVMVEHDGNVSHLRNDPNMSLPDFVPVYPGGQVVQASHMTTTTAPSGLGFLDLAVRGPAAEVRNFYRTRLQASGFTVNDLDTPGLNPATAYLLGLDGGIVAKRPNTDDILTVQIRTEEGLLIRSRLLQLQWRKISEWPAGAPVP